MLVNYKKQFKVKFLIIIMLGELFLFFMGLIGCVCFFGRVCYEGDYDDYD